MWCSKVSFSYQVHFWGGMAAKRTVQEGGRVEEAKLVEAQAGWGQVGKEVRRLVFFRSAISGAPRTGRQLVRHKCAPVLSDVASFFRESDLGQVQRRALNRDARIKFLGDRQLRILFLASVPPRRNRERRSLELFSFDTRGSAYGNWRSGRTVRAS